MARVVALIPDLLFGSRVRSALLEAGHEVELLMDARALAGPAAAGAESERAGALPVPDPLEGAELLIVDLTDADLQGPEIVRSLRARGALGAARTLGFYAHVDTQAREQAQDAGFDRVVPRSRMAREGRTLAEELLGGRG